MDSIVILCGVSVLLVILAGASIVAGFKGGFLSSFNGTPTDINKTTKKYISAAGALFSKHAYQDEHGYYILQTTSEQWGLMGLLMRFLCFTNIGRTFLYGGIGGVLIWITIDLIKYNNGA